MNIPAKETGDGLNDIAYIFGQLKNIDSTIHYYLTFRAVKYLAGFVL